MALNIRSAFHALGILIVSAASLSHAQVANAQTELLSFVSEQGDYIGQGQTMSFSDLNATVSTNQNVVSISINDPVHWFYLDLAAPNGQPLTPGVYDGAARYPFQSYSQPGLSFDGDGRGCNTLTGTFTVLEANYGPMGAVQDFHATWEQHCEGLTPALFGEVEIHAQPAPPPPPALEVTSVLNLTGTVNKNGYATIGGTVTCSESTMAQVTGTVTEAVGHNKLAQGTFAVTMACSTSPTNWTAVVVSNGSAFGRGQAQVDTNTSAKDPNYNVMVSTHNSTVVNLTVVRK